MQISIALRAAGVQLVSCTEHIDDTPAGKLLHGIMASIAEFYSANLATEVVKGSVRKAQAGGTPFLAPLGYRNGRTEVDGREVRTIELDEERAPLVAWAFEAYATGEYSLRQLLEELTDRGLTNRSTPNQPERPLHLSKLNRVLRNRYYMGIVRYRGLEYQGRHQPLVSAELFERVQALLDARDQSGEKRWLHHHYLKGTVFCRRCESRLCLINARGKGGGIYPYFFCLGRQRGNGCDLPYVPVDAMKERDLRSR